jgi:hypothetical protein
MKTNDLRGLIRFNFRIADPGIGRLKAKTDAEPILLSLSEVCNPVDSRLESGAIPSVAR